MYGNTKKSKEKRQNTFWNAGALYYKTFEGSDWLITGNYGKIIRNDIRQVGLLSSSIGQISNENFDFPITPDTAGPELMPTLKVIGLPLWSL